MDNTKLNHLLFSYGSNMLNRELDKHCNYINRNIKGCNRSKHYEVLDIGILSKYKFAYKNMCIPKTTDGNIPIVTTAKATIIKDKAASVYGTITRVSDPLYNLIVKKEGIRDSSKISHYKMKTLKVRSATQNKTYTATTFVMKDPVTNTNLCKYKLFNKPTTIYQKKIVDAAKWYNLPSEYINQYLKVL